MSTAVVQQWLADICFLLMGQYYLLIVSVRKTWVQKHSAGAKLPVTIGSPVVYEEVAGVQRKVFGAWPGQGDATQEVSCPLEVLDFIGQGVHWEKEGEIPCGL